MSSESSSFAEQTPEILGRRPAEMPGTCAFDRARPFREARAARMCAMKLNMVRSIAILLDRGMDVSCLPKTFCDGLTIHVRIT